MSRYGRFWFAALLNGTIALAPGCSGEQETVPTGAGTEDPLPIDDQPPNPPPFTGRTTPAVGDFLVYVRDLRVSDSANVNGQAEFQFALRLLELNLTQRAEFQVHPTYTLWTYEADREERNHVVSGRLLRAAYNTNGSLDDSFEVYELDLATLASIRSVKIVHEELGGYELIAASEDGVHVRVPDGLMFLPWGASLIERPFVGFELPEGLSIQNCRHMFAVQSELMLLCRVAPPLTELCSDDCPLALDGTCQDPGSPTAACELGQDCADCGVIVAREACFDSCSTARNGICEDGAGSAAADHCPFGTDCEDCGRRAVRQGSVIPSEDETVLVLRGRLDGGPTTEIARVSGLNGDAQIVAATEDSVLLAHSRYSNIDSDAALRLGGRSITDLLRVEGSTKTLSLVFDPPAPSVGSSAVTQVYDVFESFVLLGDLQTQTVWVFDLSSANPTPLASGRTPERNFGAELLVVQ